MQANANQLPEVGSIITARPHVRGKRWLKPIRGLVVKLVDNGREPMVAVWFPVLGEPSTRWETQSVHGIFRAEIETCGELKDAPATWVIDAERCARRQRKAGYGRDSYVISNAAGMALERAAKALRAERAARRRANTAADVDEAQPIEPEKVAPSCACGAETGQTCSPHCTADLRDGTTPAAEPGDAEGSLDVLPMPQQFRPYGGPAHQHGTHDTAGYVILRTGRTDAGDITVTDLDQVPGATNFAHAVQRRARYIDADPAHAAHYLIEPVYRDGCRSHCPPVITTVG